MAATKTWMVDAGPVREAFSMMTSPGRLEIVRRGPVVIVDAAHNPAGMAATMAALTEAFTFSALIAILAVSEDKDVPGILDELEPVAAKLVVTRNNSPRSMAAEKLGDLASAVFSADRVTVAARLDEAIDVAVALADESLGADGGDTELPGGAAVLITGSVVTAGDGRMLLAGGGAVGGGGGAAGEAAVRDVPHHGGDRDRPRDPGGRADQPRLAAGSRDRRRRRGGCRGSACRAGQEAAELDPGGREPAAAAGDRGRRGGACYVPSWSHFRGVVGHRNLAWLPLGAGRLAAGGLHRQTAACRPCRCAKRACRLFTCGSFSTSSVTTG